MSELSIIEGHHSVDDDPQLLIVQIFLWLISLCDADIDPCFAPMTVTVVRC